MYVVIGIKNIKKYFNTFFIFHSILSIEHIRFIYINYFNFNQY